MREHEIGTESDADKQLITRTERAITETLRAMGPAVGTSLVATVLGFIALYTSPVPMVGDFGKMLSLGVLVSFLTSLFVLTTVLFIRDRFFPASETKMRKHEIQTEKPEMGFLDRILHTTTKMVLRWRVFILLMAILVTLFGFWADGHVGVETDVEKFMPQNTTALEQIRTLRSVMGSTDQVSLLITGENVLDPQTLQWIDSVTQGVQQRYPNVVTGSQSISSMMRRMNGGQIYTTEKDAQTFITQLPQAERKMVIHSDLKQTVILVNIKHLAAAPLHQFLVSLKGYVATPPVGVQVVVTGKPVVDAAMVSGLTSGRQRMTLLGMGLVFLGLLVRYRSFIKALIPIFPIGLIVGWSSGAMYLLNLKYTPLTATLGALIIGIGTEFTILLMERYFEERMNGLNELESMLTATNRIGKAVLASGLTVIGGFSALIASNFPILHDFGILTLIDMSLCLFSTLVVLPPFIVLLDHWLKLGKKVETAVEAV